MNAYDLDSLRLLARERHRQRLHEADAERLARELRASGRRRSLHWPVRLPLRARHRLQPRRLESQR